MARLTLSLLGGFQARLELDPPLSLPVKAQALLAYLALRPGQTHPRDKLAALLWGDTDDEHARSSLRHTLFDIRQTTRGVSPAPLVTDGKTVALRSDSLDVDVLTLKRLIAEGAPAALEQVAALYQGDLLEGLNVDEPPYEEWLVAERERVRELVLEALARLLGYQSKSEPTERAIQTAIRLLSLDPLQEAAHRALMRLYARQGRRGAALRQYQICVDLFQRELGAEPETETKQLYQEILQRRPTETVRRPYVVAPSRGSSQPLRVQSPRRQTPLIGRENELGRLRQALRNLGPEQKSVFIVLGEAGIGKSRLVEEISGEALASGSRVLFGRCYESERILPFGPWVAALRAAQFASSADVLDRLAPAWRLELARLLPELGPLEIRAPAERDSELRLFDAVAHLLSTLASQQPLVILIEDLHWADDMSIRLLPFVARRLERQAVLLLATARLEEMDESPPLRRALEELAAESRMAQLTLTALSGQETERLVEALAPRRRPPLEMAYVSKRVWALSEGNPFVIVETMRAIREGRIFESADGLRLPARIQEVIVGQLARLSESSRELVGVAAMIGREFEFAVLQVAAGVSAREAARGVEELVRRRVLHSLGERLDFAHDRIREVANQGILAPHRRLLHARIARAFEKVYAQNLEPHFEALGMHYQEGEVWDKAALYGHQAGAKAITRSAYAQAAASTERALEALTHLPKSPERTAQAIDLRLDLCRALHVMAQHGRVLAILRDVEAAAAAIGDQRRLARILSQMCLGLRLAGELDAATEVGQRALTIASGLGDVSLAVEARYRLGQVYADTGDYGRAVEFFRRNLNDRRDPPTSLDQGSAAWLTVTLSDLGRFAEGIALGEETVRHATESNQPYRLVQVHTCLGILYKDKGDHDHAISLLERGLEISRIWSLIELLSDAMAALGHAYQFAGRLDEALLLLEEAVKRSETRQNRISYPWHLALLSEGYLQARRPADALDCALRCVELSRKIKARAVEATALHVLAGSASHLDPPNAEKAEGRYLQAMALATELGMRPLIAHCHLGLGKLYRRAGTQKQAQEHLTNATTMYREMGMAFWLEKAEREMKELG